MLIDEPNEIAHLYSLNASGQSCLTSASMACLTSSHAFWDGAAGGQQAASSGGEGGTTAVSRRHSRRGSWSWMPSSASRPCRSLARGRGDGQRAEEAAGSPSRESCLAVIGPARRLTRTSRLGQMLVPSPLSPSRVVRRVAIDRSTSHRDGLMRVTAELVPSLRCGKR